MPIKIDDVFPANWRDLIAPVGRIGMGMDPGTTEKEKSNPTALAIIQERLPDYIVRLLIRWKTKDPDVARAIIKKALDLPHGLRARRLCVDATNERYFCADLRKRFAGTAPVELLVASENYTYLGQTMSTKLYLGNLFCNTIEDGHLLLPNKEWISKDIRLVKRERGTFTAEVDSEGNHADTFDGIKNALHALISNSGPAEASPAQVGTYGSDKRPDADRRFPDHSSDGRSGSGLRLL